MTLGSGSMLPLEGGIVRGVRRSSGGVPRSTQGGGADSAAAAQQAATRTPGAHVRVTFDQPDLRWPTATRRRLTCSAKISRSTMCRGAGCAWPTAPPASMDRKTAATSSWNGATETERHSWSVARLGERPGLIGRPAILDMPVGRGHVVAFNFNPMHRDLNRGDQRLLWNAIINWQAILAGPR